MHEWYLATSNSNKVFEFEAILRGPIVQVDLELVEVQSLDVEDVIEAKARDAYVKVGCPVLVEDTALHILSWGGLPGALVTWFMKTVGPMGICTMLGESSERKAHAKTAIGYFDGTQFHKYSGTINGSIAEKPRGLNGFAWDSIFIPDGYSQTFAEMEPDRKNDISMRRLALEALRESSSARNHSDRQHETG